MGKKPCVSKRSCERVGPLSYLRSIKNAKKIVVQLIGCTNHEEKEKKDVPFYNIPKGKIQIEKGRRDEWIRAIRREDWKSWPHEKISKACICGEHFISGTDLELMYSEVITRTKQLVK